MLRTRTLQTTICAGCNHPIALAQLNGVTFQVEPSSAIFGRIMICLELHKCGRDPESLPERKPGDEAPPPLVRRPRREI